MAHLLCRLAAVMVGVISWTTVSPFSLAGADAVLLSQGKPATASSVEGAHFPASAAVDGDGASRWSSAAADPQWLRVDLGGEYALTQVVLQWQSAYATAFQIQVSHDDASWVTAHSTTGSHGGTQTLQVTATARYVRVLGTARATAYGYSFWEFQVFGSAPAAGSASPPTTPTAGATSSSPGTGPAGTGTVKLSTPVQPIVSTGTPPRAGFQEIHANCGVTNHLSDDPIVFPGLPGASHNHTFVGSTVTNASSTPASLLTGGTSCQEVQDKSA